MLIRYAELTDKNEWYRLDRHLPENGFDEKVRNKQGYVAVEDGKITEDRINESVLRILNLKEKYGLLV